jgi:hypothetical protein
MPEVHETIAKTVHGHHHLLLKASDILGTHPTTPHFVGEWLQAKDGHTKNKIVHRCLLIRPDCALEPFGTIKQLLTNHHASPETLERFKAKKEALIRQGFLETANALRLFPKPESTRKGNLAEVLLAEYIAAHRPTSVPVYRLRYNPNIDQSMKGDDVLGFDFEHQPVRIVIGEAKFRSSPTITAVREIGDSLKRSHDLGLPASLEFVAARLFEQGQAELGGKVSECTSLFAQGKVQLEYTGLLMGGGKASESVEGADAIELMRLVVLSFGVSDPDKFVAAAYEGLV